MKTLYQANLVIKDHGWNDVYFTELRVNLQRPYTEESEKKGCSFQELIVGYSDMDESTAARIRDYIVFHLFSLEEIKKLKTQLTDCGGGELEANEIDLPIRFEAENTIFFPGSSKNQLPGLFSHYDRQQCDYFFEKSQVCGHLDLQNFEVFGRKEFDNREEKMKWAKQVINDFNLKIDDFISDMVSYG